MIEGMLTNGKGGEQSPVRPTSTLEAMLILYPLMGVKTENYRAGYYVYMSLLSEFKLVHPKAYGLREIKDSYARSPT